MGHNGFYSGGCFYISTFLSVVWPNVGCNSRWSFRSSLSTSTFLFRGVYSLPFFVALVRANYRSIVATIDCVFYLAGLIVLPALSCLCIKEMIPRLHHKIWMIAVQGAHIIKSSATIHQVFPISWGVFFPFRFTLLFALQATDQFRVWEATFSSVRSSQHLLSLFRGFRYQLPSDLTARLKTREISDWFCFFIKFYFNNNGGQSWSDCHCGALRLLDNHSPLYYHRSPSWLPSPVGMDLLAHFFRHSDCWSRVWNSEFQQPDRFIRFGMGCNSSISRLITSYPSQSRPLKTSVCLPGYFVTSAPEYS